MFSCDFCGKGFKLKCNLSVHIKTHTSNKPIEERLNKERAAEYMKKVGDNYHCTICNKIVKYKRCHIKIHKERSYSCNQCSKNFYSSWSYKLHIDTHKTEKPFSCNLCPKKFQNEIFLKNHVKTHSNKIYSCRTCDKKVACPYILKRHESVHVKKPYFCSICKKSFLNNDSLEIHFLSHSKDEMNYCDLCGKVSNCSEEHLKSHSDLNIIKVESDSINNSNYSCIECKAVFKSNILLIKHLSCFHVEHTCKICNSIFSNYKDLKAHLSKHVFDNIYSCNNCNFNSSCKSTLRKHIRNCNLVENLITCVICNNMINSKDITNHLKEHNKNGPYNCKLCDKMFTDILALKKHTIRHKAPKKFHCNLCDKNFVTNYLLKLHEIKHGEKKLTCNVCEKKFHLSGELKQHVLSHRSDKPFSCNICGKTFKRKELLRVHLNHHDSTKKFLCTVCGKSYTSVASLSQHESLHGNDIFQCVQCRKIYKCRKMLNRHLKSCGNSFLCGFCGKSFKYNSYLKKHESLHNGVKFDCKISNRVFQTEAIMKNHLNLVHESKVVLSFKQEEEY